jgi:hypothetical protein
LSIYKDKGHIIFIDSISKNVIDYNSNFNTSKIRPKMSNSVKYDKNVPIDAQEFMSLEEIELLFSLRDKEELDEFEKDMYKKKNHII